jgi:DNA-binding HxlR family transcriptional regulator
MDDETGATLHAIGDVLGAKWTLHVLRSLAEEHRGFNDLQRDVGGVTAKTLSSRLSDLECFGIVEKEVHATSPPTTTYRLTDHGRALAATVADVETLVDVVDCPGRDCPVPADGDAPAAACCDP